MLINLSIEPSRPHRMEKCSDTSTTVTLQWMPPTYPNGVIIKYSVHFDGKCIDNFGDKSVSDMWMGTVEGLLPDTEYVFEMKAHTRVGAGPSADLSIRTCELLNINTNYNQVCIVDLMVKYLMG